MGRKGRERERERERESNRTSSNYSPPQREALLAATEGGQTDGRRKEAKRNLSFKRRLSSPSPFATKNDAAAATSPVSLFPFLNPK